MTPAKGYTEMKDSGIEWVGMIPAHWHIKVLFQFVSQVKNKNKDLSETNLLSLSYGKIKRKNIDDTEGLLPASFDGYNIIENNDIVLRLTDLQNDHTSLRVGRATERGIITSAYITIRPTDSRMSEYLYYLLHSFDIKKGFYGMGSGVRQGLNYDEVKMLKLLLPPLDEQSAIAAYLDTQCAKIDEIIAQAKASIEDYKQWKMSVVNDAVTHGLDPNAEMKDSGIYWMGKIPTKWGLKRLKYIFAKKKDIAGELGHTVLAITQQGIKPKNMSDKGQFALDYSKYQLVVPGDFAMNHMDLLTGWVDISQYSGVTSPDYRVFFALHPAEIDANYYKHVFQTCYRCRIFYGLGQGVSGLGRWRLPAEMFLNFVLPVPPLDEQRKIGEFLDKQCAQIDDLIVEKQSLIDNLESYKKSLIYEVVTGKRRVC